MKKDIAWKITNLRKHFREKKAADKAAPALKAAAFICAVFGWWGFLYPELTLTPDTYRVVSGETAGDEEEGIRPDWDEDIYRELLKAEKGQIRLKSRLFEQLQGISLF